MLAIEKSITIVISNTINAIADNALLSYFAVNFPATGETNIITNGVISSIKPAVRWSKPKCNCRYKEESH